MDTQATEKQDLTETETMPAVLGTAKGQFGKLRKVYEFTQAYMSANTRHPYHSFSHAKDVCHAALRLADGYSFDSEWRFIVSTAALMHDAYYVIGGKHNEEASAKLAELVLPRMGYKDYQVSWVSRLIMATKMPTRPKNLAEEIICDADLDNLGREDAIQKGHALRVEYGIEDLHEWYTRQYNFLKGHKYYTERAQELRQEGLKSNVAKLEQLAGVA